MRLEIKNAPLRAGVGPRLHMHDQMEHALDLMYSPVISGCFNQQKL